MRILILALSMLFTGVPVRAQLRLSPDFVRLLETSGLDFFQPLDGRYTSQAYLKNDLLSADFIIRSRREKLEIRYNVFPDDPYSDSDDLPHIRAVQMATHLASNDDDSIITALALEDHDLGEERFNADWGKLFYFRPKSGFSIREHCQMLVLYKAGRGTVFVFYLFDEAGEALDRRFFSLAFLPGEGSDE